MDILISIVFLITIWINVPDFTNTFSATEQEKISNQTKTHAKFTQK